jgi:nucleotide-binding universal stress UspA family protein
MSVPFSHILVYIDGSEGSLSAVMYAVLLAKQNNAQLDAMYVVDTRALSELVKAGIFLNSERDEYKNDLHNDAGRYLKHAEKLAKMKGVTITTIKDEGSAHRVVRDYIKEHDVDLLLLGGISTIRSRRDELNSETDRLMRTVNCPVLLIKDEEEIWEDFDE